METVADSNDCWVFAPPGFDAIARHAGFELTDSPVIDGHRRVIGMLR